MKRAETSGKGANFGCMGILLHTMFEKALHGANFGAK